MEFLLILFLIFLGFFAGSLNEKIHYRKIAEEEMKGRCLPLVSFQKEILYGKRVEEAKLLSGSVVVSLDYFKRILAGINNIFGGRVSAYETLLDRGRREAVIRLKRDAAGFDAVINLRIDTAILGGKVGCIEVLAHGTAVKYASNAGG